MRTPTNYGSERVAGAAHSFGRIARSAPASAVAAPLQRAGFDTSSGQPNAADGALHLAARTHRARRTSDFVAGAMHRLVNAVREAMARRRRRALVRATYHALKALDNRMLRDLGIDRHEVFAVAFDADRSRACARLRG